MKLFSIRVKKLYEAIVLPKKGDRCLLFLKVFSWKTDLWESLDQFTVKKQKQTNTKLATKICI